MRVGDETHDLQTREPVTVSPWTLRVRQPGQPADPHPDRRNAYIHFVGVNLDLRRVGVARRLYATFFDEVVSRVLLPLDEFRQELQFRGRLRGNEMADAREQPHRRVRCGAFEPPLGLHGIHHDVQFPDENVHRHGQPS